MSLVLGNRAFEIHRGDIYIYPPSPRPISTCSATICTVRWAWRTSISSSRWPTRSPTRRTTYMRENPCISLNDEQRRRIEELIELIRRRERSQGSRSTNENNRLIYNQLLSSLGKALCCEIAEAYFFNHPIQPLKQDRKDRIFQSFIFRSPRISARTTAFRSTPRSSASPRAISPRSSGKNRAATPCNGS